MSKLTEPPPVRLFAGLIYGYEKALSECIKLLEREFGKALKISEEFDFSQTAYYAKEMGSDLKRKFVFFGKLVKREKIADIKLSCNSVEDMLSCNGKRRVNIDPGYIAPEHVILATGKGYSHRVYLGKGVYADLTLIYEKKGFKSLEWTYPDYKIKNIQDMFLKARLNYLSELKKRKII